MYICEDLWGTQDLKLKQWWLKDYFLLGYPPFPFFLFIWKGKESSLHPLRSLPDPFVKVCGLVTNSLLPAWMPLLMLGMGSGPARAWTLAADRPGRKSCFHHPPTYCHTIANPRQAFCSTCLNIQCDFFPYPSCSGKVSFCLQNLGCCLNYFTLNSQVEVWGRRRWGAPKHLFIALESIHCSTEGEKWGKEESH